MVVGTWGDVVFEVSRETLRSFEGFSHETGAKLSTTEIVGREPLVAFEGPESETVAMTIRLADALGMIAQEEYDSLVSACRAGKVSAMVFGGRPWGGSGVRWIMERISGAVPVRSRDGSAVWLDASVTFRRYSQVAK